jgi:putative endopeptidase
MSIVTGSCHCTGQKFRLAVLFACAGFALVPGSPLFGAGIDRPTDRSGLIFAAMDRSVRPQNDFYGYANGTWLKNTPIPPDKSSYGLDNELTDLTLDQLHGILDKAAAAPRPPGSETQKIGDLYASFMDEPRIEMLGVHPLDAELAAVQGVHDLKGLASLFAHFQQIDVSTPFDIGVTQDARNSTSYALEVDQGGLGLPDRDYYLKEDDAKLKDIRQKYQAHIRRMLSLLGDASAAQEAQQILDLETHLARVQWTQVENRDPVKTYNKLTLARLRALVPQYDWQGFLAGDDLQGKLNYVIVSQPTYLHAVGKILQDTPLPVWKSYARWHLVSTFARYLSRPFADEDFSFYGTVVRGTPTNEARWKRGVGLVKGAIGEALGKVYVAQYFPPATKAHALALVNNLIATYRTDIESLDWMGPQTKKQAQEKLAKLAVHIGYPDKWRDYSSVTIKRDDLLGNVMRARAFEYHRQVNKLGGPIDRDEWFMTPPTVNAYYDPGLNEIVFPAAILQPPYFDAKADDAANYGAIGAVIGHEISHGFDDEGSQFDANGNLRDWWTKEDHERFAAKTRALVGQYDAVEPIPGYHVNGKLTLGENIADNSGLAIAYKAYHLSLAGHEPPVIDGMTGDQRFFLAYAQSWRGKQREPAEIALLKSNPHAPESVRGSLPLTNQPAFYSAYDVKPGDKMYRAPADRVLMW